MDGRTLWGEHALAMRRRDYAGGTIAARRYIVQSWFRWLEVEGIQVFDANDDHVERFLDRINRAPGGRCAATSHLHMFYKWARARKLTGYDPTEAIERPRKKRGEPRPIHDTDLQLALIFAQDGAHADPRMEAALLLGAVPGLRCCELGRLRWVDIYGAQARVLGKGSKVRMVPLSAEVREALDRIDRVSEWVLDGWQSSDVDHPGMRASRRFTAHFRAAGVKATAHQLRHRAATEALDKCGNIRKVQTMLGHSSIETTALYTQINAATLGDITVDVTRPTVRPPTRGASRISGFAQRPRRVTFRRRPPSPGV